MNVKPLRTLQAALGLAGPDADGKLNAATLAAVDAALAGFQPDASGDWRGWPGERKAVLCLQVHSQRAGFNPGDLDGLWGPQTMNASEQLAVLLETGAAPAPWRVEAVPGNPNQWPLERDAELRDFYGPPGEARLVTLDLPYALRLSWDTATLVRRTRCHEKVKDSLGRVLANVLAAYGEARIRELRLDLFGGGYNLRDKRGGSSMSTHAWGIAFDFDPDRNQLKWSRERASFARPEYDAWWKCWEDEGWVSLGRVRNYDWMHVQAARV